MTELETVNQAEIAKVLGVDRTTVHRYQREGMPYRSQRQGKAAGYCVPVCLHWFMGREALRDTDHSRRLNEPLFPMLFSRAMMYPAGEPWADTLASVVRLTEAAGRARDDALLVVGELRGLEALSANEQ